MGYDRQGHCTPRVSVPRQWSSAEGFVSVEAKMSCIQMLIKPLGEERIGKREAFAGARSGGGSTRHGGCGNRSPEGVWCGVGGGVSIRSPEPLGAR